MPTGDDESPAPKPATAHDLTDALITALPAWQLAVIRYNDTVAQSLRIAPSDLQCLFVLDRRGPTSPGQIARSVNLTTGATSRMIERLLRAGMVTREHDAADRRRVHVTITRRAGDALHRLYDPLDDALRRLLAPMTPKTLDQLLRFTEQAEAHTTELTKTLTAASS